MKKIITIVILIFSLNSFSENKTYTSSVQIVPFAGSVKIIASDINGKLYQTAIDPDVFDELISFNDTLRVNGNIATNFLVDSLYNVISNSWTNSVAFNITAEDTTRWGGSGGTGTVTSILAGSGMNFTDITTTGSIVLGTPSGITSTSTNSVTSTSHTHSLTLPTASNTEKGAVSVDVTNGGTAMVGENIFQIDNNLQTATPLLTDYIGFYDASASFNKKVTISDLLDLGATSTNLSTTYNTASVSINSSTGDNTTINAATSSTMGVVKVDGTTITATNGVISSVGGSSAKSTVPQSTSSIIDNENYLNFYTTVSSDKTITFVNTSDGDCGQIEISYTGAAKITFARSGYTINIASNIYDSAATVSEKSSGTAIYSYYTRNSNIYINGTQLYN